LRLYRESAHKKDDLSEKSLEALMEAEAIANREIPSKKYRSFAEMLQDLADWQTE
jgi:hypothetical protein